jgi:type VI secretion system protein ImpF
MSGLSPRTATLPRSMIRAGARLPSLFDRLHGDLTNKAAPAMRHAADDASDYAARLRHIVMRDLAILFNTTARVSATHYLRDVATRGDAHGSVHGGGHRRAHGAASTLYYGIEAIAGRYLDAHGLEAFLRAIRRAIVDFEPRLQPQTLVVRRAVAGPCQPSIHRIVIDIEAMLDDGVASIRFRARSLLDIDTRRIDVALSGGMTDAA